MFIDGEICKEGGPANSREFLPGSLIDEFEPIIRLLVFSKTEPP